jgi:hypothetical protein
LAPELFKDFVKQNKCKVTDSESFAADMFSLGVVILDIATLMEHPSIYDWYHGVIDKEVL